MMPGGMEMKMPGAGDDDEDDDSPPKQPQPGQQEEGGSKKTAREIQTDRGRGATPASACCNSIPATKLYLGTEPGKPQDRKGRDW